MIAAIIRITIALKYDEYVKFPFWNIFNLRENPEADKRNDALDNPNNDIKDGDDEGRDDEHLVTPLHSKYDQNIGNNITNTPDDCPDSITWSN